MTLENIKQKLNKIEEGCEKDLGAYMKIPKEFKNSPDKLRNKMAFKVNVICGMHKSFCNICQSKRQTFLETTRDDMKEELEFLKDYFYLKGLRHWTNQQVEIRTLELKQIIQFCDKGLGK